MKKLSKLLIIVMILSITGCLKRDSLEDIDIYTTAYPIEYITNRLYSEHSTIHSIYPDGINIWDYSLTDKQIKDYSKSSLFIFNSLSREKEYVIPMFKENGNIKIIDASSTMDINNDIEELWLDPSNFLKMAQNIRMGFKEYINNHYLKNDIDNKYEQLKLEISNLDANLKQISESATTNTIVVASDLFKFLEKYNFTVISLEENNNLSEKMIADVTNLINIGQIEYIFIKNTSEVNNTVKKIQSETDVKIETLHTISNITEDERGNNKDYISIMNENIEKLKNELFD